MFYYTDQLTEDQAKEIWDSLNAESGSILHYHMESAKATLENCHENPTAQPDYYRDLLLEMDDYETDRRDHGDDATYLAWCQETFGPFITAAGQEKPGS